MMFRNFHLINESIHCRNDVFQTLKPEMSTTLLVTYCGS